MRFFLLLVPLFNSFSRSFSKSVKRPTTTSLKHYKITGVGIKASTTTIVSSNDNHRFQIKTDLPKIQGGENEAAQPVELFLASLIGCEQATAMFVARQMQPRVIINKIEFEVEAFRDNQGALMLPFGTDTDSVRPVSRLMRIYGRAIVYTDGSQKDIDFIEKEVLKRCPIANMVQLSGCEIDIDWVKG
jgi:uncharacterized OsmC-like protein